jgi:hypothetical protein
VSPGGQHDEGVVKSDTEQQEHASEVDRLPRVATVSQQAPGSFESENETFRQPLLSRKYEIPSFTKILPLKSVKVKREQVFTSMNF